MANYSDEEIHMLLQKAADTERERCAAIVQLAREGEIEGDLRSLISRIKGGDSIETIKSE